MIVGRTLLYLDGNPCYSPEFPRVGLAATFAVDVTHFLLGGQSDLLISVQHRNSEDQSFTTLASFTPITAVGASELDATGAKEILRYLYVFNVISGSPAATDGVHLLMQAPACCPCESCEARTRDDRAAAHPLFVGPNRKPPALPSTEPRADLLRGQDQGEAAWDR